jgi:hypothetical protein
MDIKKKIITVGLLIPLLFSCRKKDTIPPKWGYEYLNTNCHYWYYPSSDSLPLGKVFTLEASVPKTFIDENKNITVTNSCMLIHGPLEVAMIYPQYQASIDSFELTAEIGKVTKDTINFSAGQLKGFRTIEWDSNSVDSFKVRIRIKPLAKGIYAFGLGQQGYRDKDGGLFKYFLKPGNLNQHLHYWAEVFGSITGQETFYCIKVY